MHDISMLLVAAGASIHYWSYGAGRSGVVHSFRSAITCCQQSATEPRLLAVGCADGSLALYDLAARKVSLTRTRGGGGGNTRQPPAPTASAVPCPACRPRTPCSSRAASVASKHQPAAPNTCCGRDPARLQATHTIQLPNDGVACDVQFDPLSKQYLLVLTRQGGMSLYDAACMTEVRTSTGLMRCPGSLPARRPVGP